MLLTPTELENVNPAALSTSPDSDKKPKTPAERKVKLYRRRYPGLDKAINSVRHSFLTWSCVHHLDKVIKLIKDTYHQSRPEDDAASKEFNLLPFDQCHEVISRFDPERLRNSQLDILAKEDAR